MLAKELVKTCPFYSKKENKIKSPYRMILDRVLVWRPPHDKKIGSIFLPEVSQSGASIETKCVVGVVMSVGPGYADNRKFNPTFVKPEWVVAFHSSDLWVLEAQDDSGKMHTLNYMGERDVKCIVDPEQEMNELSDLIIKRKYFEGV